MKKIQSEQSKNVSNAIFSKVCFRVARTFVTVHNFHDNIYDWPMQLPSLDPGSTHGIESQEIHSSAMNFKNVFHLNFNCMEGLKINVLDVYDGTSHGQSPLKSNVTSLVHMYTIPSNNICIKLAITAAVNHWLLSQTKRKEGFDGVILSSLPPAELAFGDGWFGWALEGAFDTLMHNAAGFWMVCSDSYFSVKRDKSKEELSQRKYTSSPCNLIL